MTAPEIVTAPRGTPVYAIDDRQRTINGVLGQRYGAIYTVETDLGRGVTRRRLFHGRYVQVDHWHKLRDLP